MCISVEVKNPLGFETSLSVATFINKDGNIEIEKTPRPDIYIFHELLHFKHCLENELSYDVLSQKETKYYLRNSRYYEAKEISKLIKSFPNANDYDVDYEEMRTIIGIPENESIICENSYRYEKGYPLRINLLDGAKEKYDYSETKKIIEMIKNLSRTYSSFKKTKKTVQKN